MATNGHQRKDENRYPSQNEQSPWKCWHPRRKVVFQPPSLCGPDTLTWIPKCTIEVRFFLSIIFSICQISHCVTLKFFCGENSSPSEVRSQTWKKKLEGVDSFCGLVPKILLQESLVVSRSRNPLAQKNGYSYGRRPTTTQKVKNMQKMGAKSGTGCIRVAPPYGCFQKWWYPKMDGL